MNRVSWRQVIKVGKWLGDRGRIFGMLVVMLAEPVNKTNY